MSTFLYTDPPDSLTVPTPVPIDEAVFGLTNTPMPELKDEPTPTDTSPSQMNGDVNEDNRIDIIDALLISQFYVGLHPEDFTNPAVANVNGDDKIDIIDALLVAQYYVGLIIGF